MADSVKPNEPDYAISPGEILEEYLNAYGMTQKELSDRIDISHKHINEIIKGKAPITPDTALKLERVFDRPAHFWINLEMLYRQDKARLDEIQRLKSHLKWLKNVPVKKMVELGWIKKFDDTTSQLGEVLNFFGVSSPDQWRIVWENHQVAYRQSQRYETNAIAVSAWLRKGEQEAAKIPCATYDPQRFQSALLEFRGLTLESPEYFAPILQKKSAECGVAMLFVPELPKTGVSGATRWIGDKAVIQLSLRYKTDDHLWFTFFHEAGHILKHGRKDIFIEDDTDDEKEKEANIFARGLLVPQRDYDEFLKSWKKSIEEIRRFAGAIKIAPGIVVGRLQHDGHISFRNGNDLKIRLRWTSR